MKEGNNNNFKKVLLVSILMLSVFFSVQCVNSIHVHAKDEDGVVKSNDDYPINHRFYLNSSAHNDYNAKIYFKDVTSRGLVSSEYNQYVDTLVVKGYKNKPIDMRNAKIKLSDLGFDSSNVPDTYTPTDDSYTFTVEPLEFKQMEADKSTEFKYLFSVIDQNYNLVKSYVNYSNEHYEASSKSWPWIKKDGYKLNPHMYMDGDEIPTLYIPTKNGDDDFDDDSSYDDDEETPQFLQDYQVTSADVVVPTHTLKINYIDQNKRVVFSTERQVTSYGHTSFYSDESLLNKNGITINDGQTFIPNTDKTADVNVTSSGKTGYKSFHDYGYPVADAAPGGPFESNPDSQTYHTQVDLIGKDGKNIVSMIAGSSESNMVDASHFFDDVFKMPGRKLNYKISGLPKILDLTKGPYKAYTNVTLYDVFPEEAPSKKPDAKKEDTKKVTKAKKTAKTKKVAKTKKPAKAKRAKKAAKAKKPSKAKRAKKAAKAKKPAKAKHTKKVAKAKKPSKAKRVKKAAKAKKPSKAKRAKKATKAKKPAKAKRAKKAAKAKKPAKAKRAKKATKAKKAAKTKKSAVAKKSIKVKKLSVIKSDKKKIKALKAQMKKLKKGHSKASKKKYAKAAKALKKANSSLKAATKFVNNYK